MALALLLLHWGRPLACVVDHGLRHESAQEARQTMRRLAALGIPVRLLQADIPRGPGLATRARAVRYALLEAACREAGLADLALGHHARDQAETLLLRRASGSGAAGLSAMAAVTYADGVRLLRPLLAVPPARLRATLRAHGVGWVEDPSNSDPSTPRARLRAGPLADPAESMRLGSEAAAYGAARAATEAQAAAELAAAVTLHPCGVAQVRALVGAPAMSALVWTLSGAAYPPSSDGVASLVRCMASNTAHDGTLHGARIMPAGRLGPGWLIGREAAAMQDAVPAGQRWDGRFLAAATAAGPDATLGALGSDAARLRRRSVLPSALLRTLPTLRRDGAIISVPHLRYPDAAACNGVAVLFQPARPVAPAAFVGGGA